MKKILCYMLILFTACQKDTRLTEDNSGRIMFSNTSAYLSKMLEKGGKISEVLIDDAHPGVSNTGHAETSIANPLFIGGLQGAAQLAAVYYPFTAGNSSDQYGIRYMQADAGQHRFRLLDTAANVLLDTTFSINTDKPLGVFFADTGTRFSAVVIEQEEIAIPGKARVKLLNMIPDAKGGGLIVRVAAQAPLTEGLPYLASTPYQEYPIPESERLYLNVYTKGDTLAPLMQTSLHVKAGHSYLLVAKGYTKSLLIRPPSGGILIISAGPKLDIINTF